MSAIGRAPTTVVSNSRAAPPGSVLASIRPSLTIATRVPASCASACAYAASSFVARYSVPTRVPSPYSSGTAATRNVTSSLRAMPSTLDPSFVIESVAGRPRGHRSPMRPAAASVFWRMSTSTMASDSMRAASFFSSLSMVASS